MYQQPPFRPKFNKRTLSPCLDCHAAMIRRAGQIMDTEGFHLISTGEVLNQRLPSQNRHSLLTIENESGYAGFVLRPLSAKQLPPSELELRGWIIRDQLLAIEGRNRHPQLKLARLFDIRDYPEAAGGCLLADPTYVSRLKDLMEHEGLDDIEQIDRLRIGRHFRIGTLRIIVGRNKAGNDAVEKIRKPDELLMKPQDNHGPSVLVPGSATKTERQEAAALCARYCGGQPRKTVAIAVHAGTKVTKLNVVPMTPEAADALKLQG